MDLPILDDAAKVLLGYGVLGVVTVVEGFVIRHLYNELQKLHTVRAEDGKTLVPVVQENNQITKDLSEGIESRNRTTEALVSSVDRNTVEITNCNVRFCERLSRLENALDKLRDQEIDRLVNREANRQRSQG